MLAHLRKGDVVVVWKLDRLSRSLRDLILIMDKIALAGAGFRSLTEVVDTTSPAGRMVMQILGCFAEFERSMVRERTRAGLEAARQQGRLGGRRHKLKSDQLAEARKMVLSGQRSGAEVARLFGVHRSTISRMVAEMSSLSPATPRPTGPAQGQVVPTQSKSSRNPPRATTMVELRLRVENNSKFVRGKKRVREEIEDMLERDYRMKAMDDGQYELVIEYDPSKLNSLDEAVYDLIGEMSSRADDRHCFVEASVAERGTERCW